MILNLKKMLYYDLQTPDASSRFQKDYLSYLQKKCKKNQPLVLICIGTDRATGDCLGPLVGQSLVDSPFYSVYGTLQTPVHAKNLEQTLRLIHMYHKNPFIIAVDACLGYEEHVGCVTLSSMPLLPGKGVSKKLSPVGDLSITGIVNIFSDACNETIQSTRLKTVFHLASFISEGISTLPVTAFKSQASYLHL